MKVDYATKMSILYDYYGQLLTDKQNQIFTLYHDDNLSLSEIGLELGVSKQGVHDALKKAETALCDFEEKLELAQNAGKNEVIVKKIRQGLSKAQKAKAANSETDEIFKDIDTNIEKLSI